MEPFSVQMSKTQKCLAHLGDWVSPDPRLLRLRPPAATFKLTQLSGICSSMVSSTFSSCFQRRQTRLVRCSGRVPTLCSDQGCSHSPSCGVWTQSLLCPPLPTCPLYTPPSSTPSLSSPRLQRRVPTLAPFFWFHDCNRDSKARGRAILPTEAASRSRSETDSKTFPRLLFFL